MIVRIQSASQRHINSSSDYDCMSVQSGLAVRKNNRYLLSQRRRERREIVLFVARMQYRSIRGMSRVVRVSFHSGDVLPPSHHLSSLPEGEGADIVFVFSCPSLLVPCTCNYSLRLCERKNKYNLAKAQSTQRYLGQKQIKH